MGDDDEKKYTTESLMKEISSIEFDKILGAPMKANIAAQMYCCRRTVEFIQQYGYENQIGKNSGKLASMTFKFKKKMPMSGKLHDCAVSVPLIAILPIPVLVLSSMTLNYNMRVATTNIKSAGMSAEASANASFGIQKKNMGLTIAGAVAVKASLKTGKKMERTFDLKIDAQFSQVAAPEYQVAITELLLNACAMFAEEGDGQKK